MDAGSFGIFGIYTATLLLGILHAIEPGHGKTVVAAYLVGTRGRNIDAVILGMVVTFTHTFSIIILAVIAKFTSRYFSEEVLHSYLGIVSSLIILGIGIWMLKTRWAVIKDPAKAHQHLFHSHDHSRGQGSTCDLADKNKNDSAEGIQASRMSSPDPSGEKTVTIPVALLLLYVGCVLFGFIYRGSITYFPTLFQQEIDYIASQYPPKPTIYAGFLTSVVLSFGMIGLWIAGYVSDRIKRPETAQVAVFICIIPFLYFISNSTDIPVIVYSAVFSMIFFGWQPLQNTLIAKYTTKRSHGVGYGINFFLIMGVGSLATAVGGYLTDEHGAYSVYSMLAVTAILGVVAAIGVLKFSKYSIRFNYSLIKEEE